MKLNATILSLNPFRIKDETQWTTEQCFGAYLMQFSVFDQIVYYCIFPFYDSHSINYTFHLHYLISWFHLPKTIVDDFVIHIFYSDRIGARSVEVDCILYFWYFDLIWSLILTSNAAEFKTMVPKHRLSSLLLHLSFNWIYWRHKVFFSFG